jgi:hypothetical protein
MREERAYRGPGAALPRGRDGDTLHCGLAIYAVWHRYCPYCLETVLKKRIARLGVAPFRPMERSSALSHRAPSIVQTDVLTAVPEPPGPCVPLGLDVR